MTVCIEVHRVAGRTGTHSDMIDNLNNIRGSECQARLELYLTISLVSTGPSAGVLTVAVPAGLVVGTVCVVLTVSLVVGAAQC